MYFVRHSVGKNMVILRKKSILASNIHNIVMELDYSLCQISTTLSWNLMTAYAGYGIWDLESLLEAYYLSPHGILINTIVSLLALTSLLQYFIALMTYLIHGCPFSHYVSSDSLKSTCAQSTCFPRDYMSLIPIPVSGLLDWRSGHLWTQACVQLVTCSSPHWV